VTVGAVTTTSRANPLAVRDIQYEVRVIIGAVYVLCVRFCVIFLITRPVREYSNPVAAAESLTFTVHVVIIITIAGVETEAMSEISRSLPGFFHFVFVFTVPVVKNPCSEKPRSLCEIDSTI
jgi:hypothetical protein